MATPIYNEPQGYPLEISLVEVDSKFTCSSCKQLLREPIQSFCGHRFCKKCVEYLISQNKDLTCPLCVEEKNISEYSTLRLDQTFPDNAIKREFSHLPVKCINPGCTWKGTFKEYAEHFLTCPHTPIKCQTCGKSVSKVTMDDHLASGCGGLSKECQFGCTEVVEDQHQHKNKEALKHMDLLLKKIIELQRRISSSSPLTASQLQMDQQSQKIPELTQGILRHDTLLTGLTNKLSELERNIEDTRNSASGTDSTTISKGLEAHQLSILLDTKVKTFEGIVAVLNNQIESCLSRFQQIENALETEKRARQEAEKKVTQLERMLTLKDVTITEMDLKIQLIELSSYNGTLLWKVTELSRRRKEAVEGKVTSIYSQPFYTGRTGYKMCARLYLNGDGMGKGSHISLFFVIMRGHYDGILKWPFRQKVTMMLLDQNNRENIVDAFRPDPKSSSFKKPTSDMNIASGCPLFTPLSMLENGTNAYVKDDTAFIKVIVDTTDL